MLASQSPRRRDLLTQAGYEFTVLQCKVSEIFDESMNPREVPRHLAEVKAQAALDQHKWLNEPGNLVLSADTLVFLEDEILGKPRDISEAKSFLGRMSGRTHQVITGVALRRSGTTEVWSGATESRVTFRKIDSAEIDAYVASGEPMDKAGAYGMQGEGRKLVAVFEGSWSNIVGLPLETLAQVLRERDWNINRLGE